MPRSLKKGPYVHPKLLLKVKKSQEANDTTPIKTWSRSSTIIPDMVGRKFAVHNGRIFVEFLVVEDMVGDKLGAYSFTTKFKSHGGRMAKEKKR